MKVCFTYTHTSLRAFSTSAASLRLMESASVSFSSSLRGGAEVQSARRPQQEPLAVTRRSHRGASAASRGVSSSSSRPPLVARKHVVAMVDAEVLVLWVCPV